jgi:LacI family transcriptional regulator, galactose operon repressor
MELQAIMGTNKTTIKEIAKLAGVHYSSVSRVLNNSTKYKISEKVKQKIKRIIKELEYEPVVYAQSLKTGRSSNLGIILHKLESDFAGLTYAEVLASFCREAMRHNLNSLVLPLENECFDEQILRNIRSGKADGYLIGASLIGSKSSKEIVNKNIPAVTFISDDCSLLAKLPEMTIVYVDNSDAFSELFNTLSKFGHEHLAVFAPKKLLNHPRLMQLSNVKNSNIKISEMIGYSPIAMHFSVDRSEARKAAEDNLDRILKHSVIFCASDLIAAGVCDALYAAGKIPGKDISVIGYDNIEKNPNLDFKNPFLSTIGRDRCLVGKLLLEELINLIEGKKSKPRILKVPAKFILRESLGYCK